MKHFFTSDTHFGHVTMLKYRPFSSIEEHDIAVTDNILSTVGAGDFLWHHGDVAFKRPALDVFLDKMEKAGIRVILIRGNHDDKLAWRHRNSFHEAHESLYHRFPDPRGSGLVRVYMNHYSCRTWRNSHHGSLHFFGHSHGDLPDHGRSTDVGVDAWNLRPVSLETLIEKLESAPPTDQHQSVLTSDEGPQTNLVTRAD